MGPADGKEEGVTTGSGMLEGISTPWNTLWQAQGEAGAAAARSALVLRYYTALRRYVGGIVREPGDADDVSQELALRLMRGSLAACNPDRGRFRDYLKAAARNAAFDLLRRKRNPATPLADADVAAEPSDPALDVEWLTAWRESVLEHAWSELEVHQQRRPGSVAFTVLRLRTDHPDLDAGELAAKLGAVAGREFRIDALRQALHRSRTLFAKILMRVVSDSLTKPGVDEVRGELRELGLWESIREFVADAGPDSDSR